MNKERSSIKQQSEEPKVEQRGKNKTKVSDAKSAPSSTIKKTTQSKVVKIPALKKSRKAKNLATN